MYGFLKNLKIKVSQGDLMVGRFQVHLGCLNKLLWTIYEVFERSLTG